jgi:energy-coupling factor transporter ATP-binding protein EcfA2
MNGKFIVLEGPEGCGKTTQIARLKALILRDLKCEIDRDDRMRETCLESIAIARGLAKVFPRAALSIVVGLRFAFALGDWDARSTWDDLYAVISEV